MMRYHKKGRTRRKTEGSPFFVKILSQVILLSS